MNATTNQQASSRTETISEIARIVEGLPANKLAPMLEVFRKNETQGTINTDGMIDDLRLALLDDATAAA